MKQLIISYNLFIPSSQKKIIDYHSLTNVQSSKITSTDHLSFPSREVLNQ